MSFHNSFLCFPTKFHIGRSTIDIFTQKNLPASDCSTPQFSYQTSLDSPTELTVISSLGDNASAADSYYRRSSFSSESHHGRSYPCLAAGSHSGYGTLIFRLSDRSRGGPTARVVGRLRVKGDSTSVVGVETVNRFERSWLLTGDCSHHVRLWDIGEIFEKDTQDSLTRRLRKAAKREEEEKRARERQKRRLAGDYDSEEEEESTDDESDDDMEDAPVITDVEPVLELDAIMSPSATWAIHVVDEWGWETFLGGYTYRSIYRYDLHAGCIIDHWYRGGHHRSTISAFRADVELNCLYSGAQDNTVKVWDRDQGKCVQTRTFKSSVMSLGKKEESQSVLFVGMASGVVEMIDVRRMERPVMDRKILPSFVSGIERVSENLYVSVSMKSPDIAFWKANSLKLMQVVKGRGTCMGVTHFGDPFRALQSLAIGDQEERLTYLLHLDEAWSRFGLVRVENEIFVGKWWLPDE